MLRNTWQENDGMEVLAQLCQTLNRLPEKKRGCYAPRNGSLGKDWGIAWLEGVF